MAFYKTCKKVQSGQLLHEHFKVFQVTVKSLKKLNRFEILTIIEVFQLSNYQIGPTCIDVFIYNLYNLNTVNIELS